MGSASGYGYGSAPHRMLDCQPVQAAMAPGRRCEGHGHERISGPGRINHDGGLRWHCDDLLSIRKNGAFAPQCQNDIPDTAFQEMVCGSISTGSSQSQGFTLVEKHNVHQRPEIREVGAQRRRVERSHHPKTLGLLKDFTRCLMRQVPLQDRQITRFSGVELHSNIG